MREQSKKCPWRKGRRVRLSGQATADHLPLARCGLTTWDAWAIGLGFGFGWT